MQTVAHRKFIWYYFCIYNPSLIKPRGLQSVKRNTGITVTGTNDPLTYLWSPGGETTPSISGLSQGDYTVVASDTSGCQGTNVFHIVNSCGYISGNVFTDENANNVFDTGEDTFPYGTINSTGNFVYQSLLTNNGAFSNQVGGGNFITNFIPFNNFYFYIVALLTIRQQSISPLQPIMLILP